METEDAPIRLSFVSQGDAWTLQPSGNYAADCQAGRIAAEELFEHMDRGGCPTLLGHIARAIAEKQRWTGLEVGFFHVLGAGMNCHAGASGDLARQTGSALAS